MSLAKRSIQAVFWNSWTNILRVAILFIRSIILARILPVNEFGTFTLYASIIAVSSIFIDLGMDRAFLHRSTETHDETFAANIFFTLIICTAISWGLIMAIFVFQFLDGLDRTVILLLILSTSLKKITLPPRLILIRRVNHRRLAVLMIINVFISSIIGVIVAWWKGNIWALLSIEITPIYFAYYILYFWRPFWHPRLVWSWDHMRYFIKFGWQNVLANLLSIATKRFDDLWTGIFLGKGALGFYSRAYTFASYPSNVLGNPVNKVAIGTYAELKSDPLRLSQAFFRMNALLIRSGFLFASLLIWIAPEFIHIGIGEKWLPMLDTFRILLIFTLLSPIKETMASLFVAVGNPKYLVKSRTIQFGVLVITVSILGPFFGINGIALAADLMMISGITLMVFEAKKHVDISVKNLFLVPIIGLIIGNFFTWMAVFYTTSISSDLLVGIIKIVIFSSSYLLVLILMEKDQLMSIFHELSKHLAPRTMNTS